ncbi:hybrid sensor histidine kinase/response regulator [Opitutus terrae]|uniref:histidine kinase n=1 Tax=Opitutus terrae (strain DSM 11246 / JCM 15787 / PB90-1) TaxID=452637 RepID=B1ZNF7_OPITP|nr:ATP-binding protein [Opitutus terrae]ACB74391.1 histidine kinase [Opitutus terrae PB90-1]
MTLAPPAGVENRVLLFVPTRKDADVSRRLLAQAGLPATVCVSMAELTARIAEGAAAVLATSEMVESSQVDELLRVLAAQEQWSDLPFVLLIKGGPQSPRANEILQKLTNVTLLERPAGMRSVLSAVQAAVRARVRQYQGRSQIQALREAEAKARRADQTKDQFLAALSHELRTPLTPVLLLATEAAAQPALDARARQDFEMIARNVALEARLIDDLLDLTRISRGKMKLEKQPQDVLHVLRDAMENVRPDFAEKRLELTTVLPALSAVVSCDGARLQQVFWNVLKNAAKFTPVGGKVTIQVRFAPDGAQVITEITDNGMGMTAAELGRVFEAFVQGDHANAGGAHRFGGLGLGLAISRSLVVLHDGSIEAQSDGPGHGTTITIRLPLAPAESAGGPGGADPDTARAGAPLRILLVEDHEPTRNVLKRLLAARKHDVIAAATLAEARVIAQNNVLDLLITDLGLPDGNGLELMQELTARSGLTAVALTGYGMDDDVQRSKSTGFFMHLTKPLRIAELDRMLAAVDEQRSRAG